MEVPSTSNPIHKADMCVCVCVCVRERERERETPVRPSKAAATCGFIKGNGCRSRQRGSHKCNWVGI